jgi:hypothetical protein
MNWGKSIIAAFIFFAIFIFVLAYLCIRQDMPLVSKEYYKDEINYQAQIDRLTNTSQLDKQPTFKVIGSNLVLAFNKLAQVEEGELKLFRPSDIKFDKRFQFQSQADSIMVFDVKSLPAGMYRAKMQWKMLGKEYFVEEIVNL